MTRKEIAFRIFYGPVDNPLDNFYIPALSASVQYDRSAGYFSSSALVVAAAGVARLIQNGGRMRDELLSREIFYSLKEAQVLIEMWRKHYNTVRPHSSLGYRPPAPETIVGVPSQISPVTLTL
jgi:transposase InsO family protein